MRASPNVENYFLGKGILYFDKKDVDGNSTGEMDLGNAPTVTITPTIETLDHFSSRKGLREKDHSVEVSAAYMLRFTLDEYSRRNIMLAIYGDVEGSYTQTNGAVVNESITANLDSYAKLEFRSVTAVVVTNVPGTVTYTLGTDYVIEATVGMVKPITGGAISQEQALFVDYNHEALNYATISAMERTPVEGSARFVGSEDQTGPRYEVEIPRVKLKPTGDLNLISEDWGTIEFEGEVLKDEANNPDSPWFTMIDLDDQSTGS